MGREEKKQFAAQRCAADERTSKEKKTSERERERREKRETRRFEIFVRRDITFDDDARRPPRAC